MLTIEIKINGRLIGGAQVTNTSNLAALSDYEVMACEAGSDETGLGDFKENFRVRNHLRAQTVWSLVAKVALSAVESRRRETQAWKGDEPSAEGPETPPKQKSGGFVSRLVGA